VEVKRFANLFSLPPSTIKAGGKWQGIVLSALIVSEIGDRIVTGGKLIRKWHMTAGKRIGRGGEARRNCR